MEEIKVGEYVRLARNQGINKIIEIEDKRYVLAQDIADEYGDCTCVLEEYQLKDEIIKHSFNIIDLAEEGDIAKYRINNLSAYKIGEVKKYKDARSFKEYLGVEGFGLEQIEILKILTKEQFETVVYELEG